MIPTEVLAERIAHARGRVGLSQADVAERLGVSRPTYINTEKGRRRPSDEEIVRLASILGVEVYDLVNPRAVKGGYTPRFRAAGGDAEERQAAVDQLERLGKAYVQLERLCQVQSTHAILENHRQFEADHVPAGRVELEAESAARLVRLTMGVSDAPLGELNDQLEEVLGVRIFYMSLPSSLAGLFIWGDEIRGCIGINEDHPVERRRWSLLHECGHFLRDREAGDILPLEGISKSDPSERFAEAFAKHMLLPGAGLSERFTALKRQRPQGLRIGDLVRLAHDFGASFQATCLRLEELRFLPTGAYSRMVDGKFKPREAKHALNLSPMAPSHKRPRQFVHLVFVAFAECKISETELAEYLGEEHAEARRLFAHFSNQFMDDGCTVALSLGDPVEGDDA